MSYSYKILTGDAQGAFISSLVALPMTIPLGALALSPLGPEFIPLGVVAGFLSSILGGGVAAIAGGNSIQISGPRASVALLMGGMIASTLAAGASREQALVFGLVGVFLSGMLQILFGLARLGSAVRYVPYPVLAGFVNGVGLVIIVGQLASAFGMPATGHWSQIIALSHEISLGAVIVTLATMGAMVGFPKVTRKIPPTVGALLVGIALNETLRLTIGADHLGPVVTLPPTGLPSPRVIADALALPWSESGSILAVLAPTIIILALVSSTEAVMSSSALDSVSGQRSNPNRELIGQGLGNCISTLFGGVAGTGGPNRGVANYTAGGRTRASGVLHAIMLLALLLFGETLLAHLPYAVLAGIMIMIGWAMVDLWAFKLAHNHGRKFYADCIAIVFVAGLIVVVNLAFAVFIGLCITVVIFVFKMSRPIMQQRRDRSQVRSRRVRSMEEENILSQRGQEIVVLGLDGPLFFGTTEKFRSDVEREKGVAQVLILDLRRVGEIDVSGVRMLRQIGQDLAKAKCLLVLAGLSETDPRRVFLLQAGITLAVPPERLITTVDTAIEFAEQQVLGAAAQDAVIDLADFSLLRGFTQADVASLRSHLRERTFEAGQTIFNGGDEGDGFHLIRAGSVDIVLPPRGGAAAVRLATFEHDTIFGEMALLSGATRSASAVARGAVRTWFMPNACFTKLKDTDPELATRLLMNIGKELADRLRIANAALQSQT